MTLSGTVIGRDTGQPIAGAVVVLVHSGDELVRRESAVTTDAEGAFLASGNAAATQLFVFANGYSPHLEPMAPSGESVRVVLERGAKIAGRVLAPDDSPVEGVRVISIAGGGRGTWPFERDWIQPKRPSGSESITGPDGRFELSGLEAGREYRIDARKPGWRVHHELGPVDMVRTEAPSSGLELRLSPLAGVTAQAVDADSGHPIPAELSARGGAARGVVSSFISIEDVELSGYHLTDIALSSRFSAYYIQAKGDDTTGGPQHHVITVKARAIGYEPVDLDVPLRWGEVQSVDVPLKKSPATKWLPVRFKAGLPNSNTYTGKLVLRLRRNRDQNGHRLLSFADGVSEPVLLPEGSYSASPGGVGARGRWWLAAGGLASFELPDEQGGAPTVDLALKGTPVHLQVRNSSGGEILDFGVGVRADRAAQPFQDPNWALSLRAEEAWEPGADRVLWLSPGKFELVIMIAGKRVASTGIEVDGSGEPRLLKVNIP